MPKGVNVWDEKVRCLHCEKVVSKKYLTEHTQKLHKGKTEKYASTVNKSIFNWVVKGQEKDIEVTSDNAIEANNDNHNNDSAPSDSCDDALEILYLPMTVVIMFPKFLIRITIVITMFQLKLLNHHPRN